MKSLGLCSPVSEECPGSVLPKGRSCVCCWAQPGEAMEQTSSTKDILAWEWESLLGMDLPCPVGPWAQTLHTLTFPLSFWTESLLASALGVLLLWGGTGTCVKGTAQNSWRRDNSQLVPAQRWCPALPSSPRAGAEGLEPGSDSAFSAPNPPSSAELGSEETPPGCIVGVVFFNQERFTTLTTLKAEKFFGEKYSQSSSTKWVFSMEEQSLVWVFIAQKNSSCFGQNRNRAEPWACGGSFPTKEQILLAGGGVQGCSWEENSSGQCFGSGNSFPCYWTKSITFPALIYILHNTTSETWHPLNPHRKCEFRNFFLNLL